MKPRPREPRHALISERDTLRREIEVLDRRYRDLKIYTDAVEANAKRNRLWDVEEALREMDASEQ